MTFEIQQWSRQLLNVTGNVLIPIVAQQMLLQLSEAQILVITCGRANVDDISTKVILLMSFTK